MRLLIAMMKHETNTFSPVPTPLERFRPLYGEAAVRDALGRRPVQLVHAADYAAGLSASLRTGLGAVPAAVEHGHAHDGDDAHEYAFEWQEAARIALAEERDRALAALKELEFDHRTGKVSDEDYRTQVGPLRQHAAATLRALEREPADHEEERVGAGGRS